MKNSTLKSAILLVILIFKFGANAQFKNGDFNLGDSKVSPQIINDWTNGGAQFVPDGFTKSEDAWVDLTGTGFGNGYYIEQTLNTVKDVPYVIKFDLGTFYAWDLWDAGVTISLDGKPLGGRLYHSNFTYSQDNIIYWVKMQSAFFIGTGSPVTVRFTGNSELIADQGWKSGVGVIALDNVSLEKYGTNGINSLAESLEFNVFPNPANTCVHIEFPKLSVKQFDIVLKDITGKVVYKNTFEQSDSYFTLNTSELSAGLYYLNMACDAGVLGTKKITVTH